MFHNLPLLYGGQHVFIAIYLLIHSSVHFFIHYAIGVGNTKTTSYLCSLDLPLKSCCQSPYLTYIQENNKTKACNNLNLFLRVNFLSLQISFNHAIMAVVNNSHSNFRFGSILANDCTKVFVTLILSNILIVNFDLKQSYLTKGSILYTTRKIRKLHIFGYMSALVKNYFFY